MNEAKAELCKFCESKGSNLCSHIDEEDFLLLTAITDKLHISRDNVFIEEGENAKHFFSLTSGVAKLYKLLPDGRRQITGFARPGDFLGLAVSDRYAFSAEAVTAIDLCRHSRPKMLALFKEFPEMERCLLRLTSNELIAAQEQMLLLGRKSSKERVASFLLTEVLRSHKRGGAGTFVDLPMARGDIADFLGLTTETVSRTVTWLRSEKILLTLSPHRLCILDMDALNRAAGGQPTPSLPPAHPLGAGGQPHHNRGDAGRDQVDADDHAQYPGCGSR